MEKFKFLEHTADVKFQAFGNSLEGVFENSALAFKEVVCGKINVKKRKEKKIKVNGKDNESLLYNFLEEFLYLLDAENFLVAEIKSLKIDKKNFKLNTIVLGDKASDYDFVNDVKAVTYSEMFVKKQGGIWKSQVVLDV